MATKNGRTHVPIDRKLWEQAMKDHERSTAIMAEIGFDIMLATIIKDVFSHRTEAVEELMNGISMSQKAKLAYIMGIINKTTQNDLEKISKIRNKFGHGFEASFTHTEVLRLVQKLSTAKGKRVTANNASKFYSITLKDCWEHLNEYQVDKK